MESIGQFVTMLRRPEGLVFILPLVWLCASGLFFLYVHLRAGKWTAPGPVEKSIAAVGITVALLLLAYFVLYAVPAAPLH